MMGIPNSPWWFTHRVRARYWLAFVLALVWTLLWGCSRWPRLYWRYPIYTRRIAWRCAFAWGRRECPEPVVCERCGWAGPRRWAVHTYGPAGWEDVEPVDECPKCGEEV